MTATSVAVAETHSSWVFFVADRAYKLKKPIDLGFVDNRERAARESLCHREVELNRRLAPDVYLGVADLTGPDGELCDHLVVMRRLPEDRRLSAVCGSGEELRAVIRDVARQVTGLHERSTRSDDADLAAGVAGDRARWNSNSNALFEMAGEVFDEEAVSTVHALACRYLDGRQALFDDRVAQGTAVDGHGDLLADDIFCMPDGARILDCLEFDDGLRLGDGLADVAFLAMDLERLERADLARELLAAYADDRGDAWPASLAHHHIAYRAQVRAKVEGIRSRQGDADAGLRARRLLELARAHLEQGRVRVVLVGGLPGTGKSTLARNIAGELDAVLLRSDEIRKQLQGLPVDEPAPAPWNEGIYEAESTERVYAAMLAQAEGLLRHGESVVIDASWSARRHRRGARDLAEHTHSDLAELECVVPPDVARSRIVHRRAHGHDASDATPEIAATMATRWDPWPEAETVDTRSPARRTLDTALVHLRLG